MKYLFLIFLFFGNIQAADWTYFVWLNADNNLAPYGVSDMEEMAAGELKENLVVLYDGLEEGDTKLFWRENGEWKKEKLPELDMGDWENLVFYTKLVMDRWPSYYFGLEIWNHGNGLKNNWKNVSYDDHGTEITTQQLGLALKEIKKYRGGKIDLLVYDACLMQMLGVVYEYRKYVSYQVASEETIPGAGFNYEPYFKNWNKLEDTSPLNVIKALNDHYAAEYSAEIISGLDLNKLDKLVKYLDILVDEFVKLEDWEDKWKKIKWKVEHFTYYDYLDLKHIILKMGEHGLDTTNVLRAFDEVVIDNRKNWAYKNAYGLSIYAGYKSAYEGLKFEKSNWMKLLK